MQNSSGRGWDGLTARENEVVKLLSMGRTQVQIARLLVISPRTVYAHVNSARRKVGAESAFDLAVKAARAGR